MTEAVRIVRLDDHPFLIDTIEQHFITEWRQYYGPAGPGDARADIASLCKGDSLPLGLVALKDKVFCGIVALRGKTNSHPELGPWVTSFYVVTEMRRQGMGAELLNAIEVLARELDIVKIYASSATAVALFRRRNWAAFDRGVRDGQSLTFFCKVVA